MTPLIKALVAAQEVGFDAPECGVCGGSKTRRALEECYDNEYWAEVDTGEPCRPCYGTGLDASDPERLIGRAMGWLQHKGATNTARRDDDWHAPPFKVDFTWPTCVGLPCSVTITEAHDGTPAGLATALLRLVARVGGAT